jgi:hypothetical protein
MSAAHNINGTRERASPLTLAGAVKIAVLPSLDL